MGYACPVCETPQRDADHLADHLAFTALVHGDDHEEWLDDNAPGWAEDGTAALASRVADLAPERDYEEVFEDTARGHAPGDAGGPDVDPGTAHERGSAPALDDDARETVERARAMTREMLEEGDDADADENT
jgi:hypothetical protein